MTVSATKFPQHMSMRLFKGYRNTLALPPFFFFFFFSGSQGCSWPYLRHYHNPHLVCCCCCCCFFHSGRCGSGTSGRIPPGTLHRPDCAGAGSAGPLRGRKRDVWEGGASGICVVSLPFHYVCVALQTCPIRVSLYAPLLLLRFLLFLLFLLIFLIFIFCSALK